MKPEDVTPEMVEAVEDAVGYAAGGWDCAGPREIIAAAMSLKPKESLYRRKPLAWEHKVSDATGRYYCVAHSPLAGMQTLTIGEREDGLWNAGIGEPCDLETAKARVEAEITRRLESVLKEIK